MGVSKIPIFIYSHKQKSVRKKFAIFTKILQSYQQLWINMWIILMISINKLNKVLNSKIIDYI